MKVHKLVDLVLEGCNINDIIDTIYEAQQAVTDDVVKTVKDYITVLSKKVPSWVDQLNSLKNKYNKNIDSKEHQELLKIYDEFYSIWNELTKLSKKYKLNTIKEYHAIKAGYDDLGKLVSTILHNTDLNHANDNRNDKPQKPVKKVSSQKSKENMWATLLSTPEGMSKITDNHYAWLNTKDGQEFLLSDYGYKFLLGKEGRTFLLNSDWGKKQKGKYLELYNDYRNRANKGEFHHLIGGDFTGGTGWTWSNKKLKK